MKPEQDPQLLRANEPGGLRPGQTGADLTGWEQPPSSGVTQPEVRIVWDPAAESWYAAMMHLGRQVGRRYDVTEAIDAIVAAKRKEWEAE